MLSQGRARELIYVAKGVSRGEKNMEFYKRVRVSMAIVIVFCMMCVSTVLAKEEQIAKAESEQDIYAACEEY